MKFIPVSAVLRILQWQSWKECLSTEENRRRTFWKHIAANPRLNKLLSFSGGIHWTVRTGMKKNKKEPVHVHGTILATDVDRFNSSGRSNVDRAAIRSTLQRLLVEFLEKCSPCKKVGDTDHGDAAGIIFSADSPKRKLLKKLIEWLPSALRKHNRSAASSSQFLMRVALHFGEYFKDRLPLTRRAGFAGESVNHVHRILDSPVLKEAIHKQKQDQPVALMLSDDFYRNVVEQQIPDFKNNFLRRIVKVKDGELVAWLYVDHFAKSEPSYTQGKRPRPGTTNHHSRSVIGNRRKEAVTLDTLPPSIYVSAADIHNFNLYQKSAGSVPLANHLETALLLGERAIVHCTDPYRSQEVFKLLTDFAEFIQKGQILFLLGSRIQSPKRDFIPYLKEKATQYEQSGHGSADVYSLSAPDPQADVKAVIEMLEMSPYLLHRGHKGTEIFIKSVRKDFEHTEVLATSANPFSGKLLHNNLTLWQILSLSKIIDNGKVEPIVADKSQIESIINEVNKNIDHSSFSRNILLSLFREQLAGRKLPAVYFELLAIRTYLLHSQINIGPHTLTEFHPQRDRNSPYYYRHLINHIEVLSECAATKGRFGPTLVKSLRNHARWRSFAMHHLRVMGDLYARRLADLETETNDFFIHSRRLSEFKPIAQTFSKQWK